MKGIWHFADAVKTRCGQEWRRGSKVRLDTVGTPQAWFSKLIDSERDKRVRCCFRCVYEVAKETGADRRWFLWVTIVQGGMK